ncbi:MAG: 4-(cytidine 5'-diphospho)-2-C-methyl-D-erythritol kinase [Caldisericia bacterium]
MKILSEAKINLTLDVLSKLPQNYHYIKSIVLKIPIYDEIIVDYSDKDEILFENIEIEDNNIEKVKELFFSRIKKKDKFFIKIRKNIPIGSGLGGGSSNAAKLLLLFNQIYNYPLPNEELFLLAGKIGSDVPLFLRDEKILLIQSKGEKIFPLYVKDYELFFAVIYPKIKISTKDVYQEIKEIKIKEERTEKVIDKLINGENFIPFLGNDLEEYAFKIKPELIEIKEFLLKHNALNVFLTGSGSSFVCFFNSPSPLFLLQDYLSLLRKNFQFDFQIFLFHALGWEKIYRIDMQK